MHKHFKILISIVVSIGLCFHVKTDAQDNLELLSLARSANPEQLPEIFNKIACLENIGVEEIKTLISFLSDKRRTESKILISADITVSRYAGDALVKIGAKALPALSNLVEVSSCDEEKIEALWVIGRIGMRSTEIQLLIQKIIESESTKNQYVLSRAVFALGKTAENRKEAIEILLELPENLDFFVKAQIASALAQVGSGSELAIQKLIALTFDKGAGVQKAAIAGLGEVGDGNITAKKRLEELIDQREAKFVRESAKAALEILLKKEVEKERN